MRPKQAYNWSQIKRETFNSPSPSLPLQTNRPPSMLPLSGSAMLLNSLDQLCHAQNHGFHPLPSGKDTKPGHPKREVCKACLHFLIALFSATTRICLIYAQAEPGHPRKCVTRAGPHWEGFVLLLALSCPFDLKARYTGDKHKQNMLPPLAYCVHVIKRITCTTELCLLSFKMGNFLSFRHVGEVYQKCCVSVLEMMCVV